MLSNSSHLDPKSDKWRDGADRLLERIARENKYIVSDVLIIFLESAGYGLDNYSALGGVFRRAAKKGLIQRVDRAGKQALWKSCCYPYAFPLLKEGELVSFQDFGTDMDGVVYQIAEIAGQTIKLERVE